MNHLSIKNETLTDLQLIIDMAVEDVKNEIGEVPAEVAEYIYGKNNTPKQQAEHFFNKLKSNDNVLPENMTIEHGQFSCNFETSFAPMLEYRVKTYWGNGKSLQPSKSLRYCNEHSKSMQQEIVKYRDAYQNGKTIYKKYGWGCCELLTKDQVIKLHKKAEKNDLICRCWKFITNPESLEGVHYPWINPTVKFERYGTFEVPEYMKTQSVAS